MKVKRSKLIEILFGKKEDTSDEIIDLEDVVDDKNNDSDKKDSDNDKKDTDSNKKTDDTNNKDGATGSSTSGADMGIKNLGDNTPKNNSKEEVKMAVDYSKIYNSNTGLFDVSGIEDEGLKEVLKTANKAVKDKNNNAKIEKAISDKLATLKLADGISSNTVLKLLDRSNIKVTDDGVTGVNEAFDSLKSSDSGLFKANKNSSSPLTEGLNPQNKAMNGNYIPNSFAEAFSLEESN